MQRSDDSPAPIRPFDIQNVNRVCGNKFYTALAKYLQASTPEPRARNIAALIYAWMMGNEKVRAKAPTAEAVHAVVKAMALEVTEGAYPPGANTGNVPDPASDPDLPPEAYYGALAVWIDTKKPPGANTHATNKQLVEAALGGEDSPYAVCLEEALEFGKVMSEGRPANRDEVVVSTKHPIQQQTPARTRDTSDYGGQLEKLQAMVIEMQQSMADTFTHRARSEARIKTLEAELHTAQHDPLNLDKVARAVQGLEPQGGVMTDSDDEQKCTTSMQRRMTKVRTHTVEESDKWYYPEFAMEMTAEEMATKVDAEYLRIEAVHASSIRFDDSERLEASIKQIKNAHKALIAIPSDSAPTHVYKMMRVYRDAVDAYWTVKVQVLHPQERQVYRQAFRARRDHLRLTERTKVMDFADYKKIHLSLNEGDGVSTVKAVRERLKATTPPQGGPRGQGYRGRPAGSTGKAPHGNQQPPSKDNPPPKCRWDEQRKRWAAPWDPRFSSLPP